MTFEKHSALYFKGYPCPPGLCSLQLLLDLECGPQDNPHDQGLCVPDQHKAVSHQCLHMISGSPPGTPLCYAKEST